MKIYFALVTFVTLMMLIFSVSSMINIVLKTYIFTAADTLEYSVYCAEEEAEETCAKREEQEEQRALARKQQEVVRDLSLIIVSAPLFWLHWRVVYNEFSGEKTKKKKEDDEEGNNKE